MADEKKQGGWFSRLKKDTPAGAPSAKPAPAPKQAAASPKPAPKAKPAPAPKQAAPVKNAESPKNPATTESVDTVASFQFYIDSLISVSASQIKIVGMMLQGVSDFIEKQTRSLKENQK
ncbi:hypothetical protein OO006_06620 [Prosthecochloris sp. SCSIO W1101]|uniref:hypothetical protein n=1 Tax=Prosthecochloris sp. SCSIO W1101 TaxID=2992242 RepID=UPI00223DB330|nr:hypothetical protein [Prosthecochloris sp. SCSIO W1101]UZJ42616.1 hypothetical protein OO006_06620 [Prosthecochloris sp. SCSIO W1101]